LADALFLVLQVGLEFPAVGGQLLPQRRGGIAFRAGHLALERDFAGRDFRGVFRVQLRQFLLLLGGKLKGGGRLR